MSEFESLPRETMTDILIRLPVESLRLCMCVCKSWRSLIADPCFINNQLLINRQGCSTGINNRCFLLTFRNVCGDKLCYSLRCCETFTEQKQLEVPDVIGSWHHTVIDSCNGLICLFMINELRSAYYQALVLWNPSINKVKVLPRPQFPAGFSHEQAHGFSFIPRANDYKVVRLIHNQVKDSPKVEIYTLSTNCWRTWTGDGVGYTLTDGIRPTFINGAVHWIALVSWRNPICSVLAFHMEDEVFRVIPCPRYGPFRPIIFPNGELFVASEKLAYFVKRTSEGGVSWDLWVLEDYGVAEFWTKLHSIRSHTIESVLHPLQPPKEGEVLFSGFTKKELYSFDLGKQEVKQIEVDYGMQFEVINYTESLLLLNEPMPDSASDAMDFFKCKGSTNGLILLLGLILPSVLFGCFLFAHSTFDWISLFFSLI
ncbi:F-box/kelch-repeat protein At3g23880-like [Rhododendron vialii]|uniref:F-box/kelch-repeat protein At3g23880-like n=1 Tax=Rhododendron vialii TaxID=182163 RepID=UPI00265EDB69|nr:F-box/kelch-repeat protein At3g23880-like [Rhododendron vialii]